MCRKSTTIIKESVKDVYKRQVVACPLNVIALTKEVNVKGYNYAHQILEDTCNG